jgi:hypothetical protein
MLTIRFDLKLSGLRVAEKTQFETAGSVAAQH